MPAKTHGLARTQYYKLWCEMLRRIRNPNCPAYSRYGGRGLDVDPRWLRFEAFQTDMGERPPGLTLERRDNNQGYRPDNCYWGTRKEQSHNTRRNVLVTYRGERMVLSDARRVAGIPSVVLYRRIRSGMSHQEALDDWLRWKAGGSRITIQAGCKTKQGVVKMGRKPSPDQLLGPGASIWATADSRDLLFELAEVEQRSVKVVLRRALLAYAEDSRDYQKWLANQTKAPRAKAA